jgi:hypothetical protein
VKVDDVMVDRSQLMIFLSFLFFTFLSNNSLAKGKWETFGEPEGEAQQICDGVKIRLGTININHIDAFNRSSCASAATLSYPGFSEPEWQKIDPEKHKNLIYQLFRYKNLGSDSYFGRSKNKDNDAWARMTSSQKAQFDAEMYRETENFIARGGVVLFWKIRLVSDFRREGDFITPPGDQNIVQLRYPSGGKDINREVCPQFSSELSFRSNLFFVNEDLSAPDSKLGRTASYLLGDVPMLFNGRPVFVGGAGGNIISLSWDDGGGPSEFCEIKYY